MIEEYLKQKMEIFATPENKNQEQYLGAIEWNKLSAEEKDWINKEWQAESETIRIIKYKDVTFNINIIM